EAQRYCKAINDPAARRRAEADILLVSGKGQCRLSPTRSLAELERALALYKRDGYVISDLDTYRAKAKVLTQLNRIQEAEKALLSGIEDIEHIRSKVIDDRLRILYLSSVRDLFDQMILLQAKQGGGCTSISAGVRRSRRRPVLASGKCPSGVRTARRSSAYLDHSPRPRGGS